MNTEFKLLEQIAESKRAVFNLIEHNEMLDDEGYPTDAALDVIRLWPFTDAKGWFRFIESIWHLADWGWKERDNEYHISTAGWSGNESIIGAMQENHVLWTLTWVQSRRGGHYIFEVRQVPEE